nr:Gp15 family bacteriophage protein [Enterococcus sp. 665A]MBO1343044.1 hypothetical protein [Enterococcus sp. 665A]
MRLNDPLVTSIFFHDQEYAIDLSFDIVLDVFDVLASDMLLGDKIDTVIALLFGEITIEPSLKADLWLFVRDKYILLGNSTEPEVDELGNPMPVVQGKQSLDIQQDAKYIYASFRQIGINLFEEQGKLTWAEFQALLESLPEDTIIQRIIQIRNWTPQKGDSAEYRKKMRDLKRKFALDGEEETDG